MDHGFAALTYPDQGLALFAFDLLDSHPDPQITLDITTTQGQIIADINRGTYQYRCKDEPWQKRTADCLQPPHGFVGIRESIADFFDAIIAARPAYAGVDVIRRLSAASLAATVAAESCDRT